MSLLWIEGFEGFGTTNDADMVTLRQKYTTDGASGDMLVTDGRISGKAIKITNAARTFTIGFSAKATIVIGMAFNPTSLGATTDMFRIMDGGSSTHITLQNDNGKYRILRSTGTQLAITSGASTTPGTWAYVELKVTIGNSGSYELRVNGVNVLSATGVDTQNGGNASCDRVMFKAGGSTTAFRYDDIYICDTSGSTNNDFLGSQHVVAIFPTAEGDSIQFTPSTGSDNSALVDENPHTTDTDYVESSTPGDQDLYVCQNVDLTDIKGLMIGAFCRETDASPFSIKLVSKTGSTVDEGSGIPVGSSTYVHRHRILEVDPDTGVAWTDSGVDGAQFGFETA